MDWECEAFGTFHQGDIRIFPSFSNDYQCIANAASAIAWKSLCGIFIPLTIDAILHNGDRVYKNLRNKDSDERYLLSDELPEKFPIDEFIITFKENCTTLKENYITLKENKIVYLSDYPPENIHDFYEVKCSLAEKLEHLLEAEELQYGGYIFIGQLIAVAFWRLKDKLYLFDSHAVNEKRLCDVNEKNNKARLFHCKNYFSLASLLLLNARLDGSKFGIVKLQFTIPYEQIRCFETLGYNSGGGHLQLKDEQEWSSASGEQLGGCFALNLRLLSQSLACVPAYKRLSLPKHMFSEDELKRFDNLARQANEAYNPDKIEEPNTKVMKTLTNLLQRDFDVVEEPEATKDTTTLNDFNILDVNKSNKKLLNISIESKIMPENTQVNNSNSIDDVQFNLEQNKSSFNPVNKNKTEKQINTTINCNNEYLESGENHIPIISNPMDNKVSKTDKIFEENVSTVSKTQNGNPEKQLPTPSQTIASDDVTKLTDQSVDNSKLPINEAQEDMTKETEQRSTVDPDCLIVNEPKGQRTKINRKTTVTDDVEKKSNTAQKILVLEDDDDDDLDRLLSLRKPVNSEKKEFKTVQSKNSGAGLQSASAEPNSELDDWLDSVLQN